MTKKYFKELTKKEIMEEIAGIVGFSYKNSGIYGTQDFTRDELKKVLGYLKKKEESGIRE